MPANGIDPLDPTRALRWEACRYPERPPDKMTEFIVACPACVLKLVRTIEQPPPPGAFTGYWDDRENIRANLVRKGLLR